MLSIARALAILVFALFSAAIAVPVPKSVDVRVEELKAKVDEMTLAANSKKVSKRHGVRSRAATWSKAALALHAACV